MSFNFGDDHAVTKKCPHCDTALEFISAGQRVRFTAHDEVFCQDATRERVRLLERVILSQREAYERRLAQFTRQVDAMLAEHGIPSLKEQAESHERIALLARIASTALR